MIKFYKLIFFLTLIMGTLIAISSYSWMSMWLGLEINLLSIIPLMKNYHNMFASESALKYFITQALASNILMFTILLMFHMNQFIPMLNMYIYMMMNSALLTKLGAAPFHFWFPEIIEGLNWNNTLIMLTWQKIAPMILISFNLNMTLFFSIIISVSSMIGGIQGLNQISLRKILAYSSINHLGWMIASMLSSSMIWLIYLTIYITITINIILMFMILKCYYLKQLFNSLINNKLTKFFFIMNFMSLSGLPPFLGFFPKWLTLHYLIYNNFYMLSMMLILFTLINMFIYMRICFSTLLINSNESQVFFMKNNNFWIMMFNFMTLSSLFIMPLIFNFM